ncbi:MAG: glycosyltransferase [Nitrospirae bacterium]|nr:glycosyltransferase [Nitrospirota bacterium]
MFIHKQQIKHSTPSVSLILLDWSCRESFHALDWLSRQNIPRDQYEIIWVELYDRVLPEAMEKADVVITCGQKGMYHKHVGYNAGLLHSKGQVITVCDSDAAFPPDFISSIIKAFNLNAAREPASTVLMHYERRTKERYPKEIKDIRELQKYSWIELWPNVGACMSVRKTDAIRFGGFDEHSSFRGYLCGPYDLGWRLVNAGIPEIWHDESVALWHFAHPDPLASFDETFSLKLWREATHLHIEGHALVAVEAFSTGRLLPLKENLEVYKLRMGARCIGTKFEEKYARMTVLAGFSKRERSKFFLSLILLEPFRIMFRTLVPRAASKWLGPRMYGALKGWWYSLKDKKAT